MGSSLRMEGPRRAWSGSALLRSADEHDGSCAGGPGCVCCVFCGGGSDVCVDAGAEEGGHEVSGGVPRARRTNETHAGGNGGDVGGDRGAGGAIRDDLSRRIGSGGGCTVWRVDRSIRDWDVYGAQLCELEYRVEADGGTVGGVLYSMGGGGDCDWVDLSPGVTVGAIHFAARRVQTKTICEIAGGSRSSARRVRGA